MRAQTCRRSALLVALVLGLLLAACARLPESGPVTPGSTRATVVPNRGVDFVPPPPEPGDPPEAIVQNFLVAMQARPLQTSVARQYLTQEAADAWQPSSTYVYSDYTPEPSGDSVVIKLEGGQLIDPRGTWRGPMGSAQSRITFPVVQEDGQWRIARTPNALFVRDYALEQAFTAAQVGWFDPSGSILVPEPVHVVSGDSVATALVRCLAMGPPDSLKGVVATYVPAGLTVDTVPVSGGEADVRLEGSLPPMDPEDLNRMVAQLAWTLRQVPGLDTFRVAVGDRQITLPGRVTQFPVARGGDYDPLGFLSDESIWALGRGGGLLRASGSELAPVAVGGDAASGWRSAAVSTSGERIAGVSQDGSAVSVTAVGREDERVRLWASGGRDLLEPRWDAQDRLWLMDRSSAGALILLGGERPRALRSAGLNGERVRSFLVSRDGSRLVAVLAGPVSDRVVMARVLRNPQGRVTGLTPAEPVPLPGLGEVRIRDIAWKTVTSVSLVFASSPEVSQVRTVSLDGSPDAEQTAVTTVRGSFGRLVGSPDRTLPSYVVARDEIVPLDEGAAPLLLGDARPATLGYAG